MYNVKKIYIYGKTDRLDLFRHINHFRPDEVEPRSLLMVNGIRSR